MGEKDDCWPLLRIVPPFKITGYCNELWNMKTALINCWRSQDCRTNSENAKKPTKHGDTIYLKQQRCNNPGDITFIKLGIRQTHELAHGIMGCESCLKISKTASENDWNVIYKNDCRHVIYTYEIGTVTSLRMEPINAWLFRCKQQLVHFLAIAEGWRKHGPNLPLKIGMTRTKKSPTNLIAGTK